MNDPGRPAPDVAQLLPPDVRGELTRAAATYAPQSDPLRRQKAIEKATARAKFLYPQLFKHKEL
jgi:hypothetical protein